MQDARLRYLIDGRTIAGREILLKGTHEQNWIRSALISVQTHLMGVDPSAGDAEVVWIEAMTAAIEVSEALVENLSNPIHYGDNKPGLFDIGGRPITPDRVHTYFDLWQFGVTGEDGFDGFIRDCDLPPDTQPAAVLRAAGFLLVDEGVTALQGGRDAFAGYLMYQAQELALDGTLLELNELTPGKIKQAIEARMSSRACK